MLEYKIIESRLKNINIDFVLLPKEPVEIEADVNAIMKVPGDKNINRVLFEITFKATEKKQISEFIVAGGEVVVEFNEKPDYDKVSQGEYPTIAMKELVKKIDDVIADMNFMQLSFSNNDETQLNN